MMRRIVQIASISALILLPITSRQALAAPVSVISQTRSVHIVVPSNDLTQAPDIDQTTSASNNDPFTASLDQSQIETEEDAEAAASQTSSFGNSSNVFSVNASGATSYHSSGNKGIVDAESNFEVQFQVFETRNFTIDATGSFLNTDAGASDFNVVLKGPSGNVAVFRSDLNLSQNVNMQLTTTFSQSGTLAPGVYTLDGNSADSGGGNPVVPSSFSFDFSATGPSTSPVPLPSAARSSISLLAVLAGMYGLCRGWRKLSLR